MNKLRYRVIFSAARGMLVAVQETARSAGKAAGTTAGAVGVTVAALLAASPAGAQIAGDLSAPGHQRPTVLAAPNGVPMVNITTPSAAGVSRNVYKQFDVNANGAILNNSRTAVQSQLGGYIPGNPWLAKGSARVILNEVNSASPSYLRGYVEVAGPKAEVVIANPSGIQVQGGGFINSSRVTLTTGVPQLNAYGGIESYRVTGGSIGVSGGGLDMSGTEFAALYARMVSINGGVWGGGELRVATGANQIGADGAPGAAADVTPIAGTGAAQPLAFDVGALGGMYSQKIWIMGTEAGVGARSAGTIQTGAGDAKLMGLGELTVTSAGRIENIGTIQAAGAAVITAPSFDNSGKVLAAGSASIAAQSGLINSGTLEGQRIELASAGGDVTNSGTIRQTGYAGLTLAAPSLLNTNGGTIGAEAISNSGNAGGGSSKGGSGSGDGSGTGGGADTGSGSGSGSTGGSGSGNTSTGTGTGTGTGGTGSAAVAPGLVSAAGAIRNEGGRIYAGGPIELQTPHVSNAGGTLSASSLAVSGAAFSNAGGTLNITNGFSADVANFDNTGGKLSAGRVTIATPGDLLNQDGSIASNSDARMDVGGLVNNQSGKVAATGALDAQAAGAIRNASGSMLANQGISIQAKSLDNTLGNIASSKANTSIAVADALTNSGQISAAADLALRAGSLANSGNLRADNDASISVANVSTNDASITAGRNASITARSLQGGAKSVLGAGIQADGGIGAAGDLSVTATGALVAKGTNLAAGDASLQGASVDLSGSQTSAANIAIGASQGDVNTSGATVATTGNAGTLRIDAGGNADQTLINTGGTLSAARLDIHASNISNTQGGRIVQTGAGATQLSVAGVLDNSAGTIASNGSAAIAAARLLNRGGSIQAAAGADLALSASGLLDNSAGGEIASGGQLTLDAGRLVNDAGKVTAVGNLASTVVDAVSNIGGTLAANGDTRISAASLDNGSGTIAAVKGALKVSTSGATVNAGGTIQAGGDVSLANAGFDNSEGKVFGDTLAIDTRGNTLANSRGTLAAVKTVDVDSGALDNSAGLIQSGAAMRIDTHGQALSNTNAAGYAGGRGGISSAGTLTMATGALNNAAGTISAKDALKASTQDFANTDGGIVFSQSSVAVDTHGATYDNSGGQTQAVGDLSVDAGAVLNASGLVRSGATTTLHAGTIVNSGTQGSDQGIEGQSVALDVGRLDNTLGAVRSAANTTITSAGSVDNTSGLISAGDTLRIADPKAANPTDKTLAVTNTGGTLVANKSLQLDASRFSADGTVASGRDLSIALTQDIVNDAEVSANGDLSYTTTGTLTNNGKLLAGGTLTAGGSVVENTAYAEMSGSDTRIVAGTLNNRGLIDSHGQTRIDAGVVNNIATGRIYGDAIAIGAGTLNNVTETTGSSGIAATIAARSTLDIGAGTINNRDGALLFSAGDMFIGGALDGNGFATGRGSVLNNESASIESLGDMAISTETVNNIDTHLVIGQKQETSPYVTTVIPTGGSEAPISRFILDPDDRYTWYINDDGSLTPLGRGWIEKFRSTTTITDYVASSAPSRLVAGGDMTIDGLLRNHDSKVIAGGRFTASLVDNVETQGKQVTRVDGWDVSISGFDTSGKSDFTNFPAHLIEQRTDSIKLGGFEFSENTNATQGYDAGTARVVDGPDGSARNTGNVKGGGGPGTVVEVASTVKGKATADGADAKGSAAGSRDVDMVVRTSTPDTRLPTASLFQTKAGAGGYLIETDPRFADYRHWLSSDYLLNAMGFDPISVQKRLGDGFYEQKLIREQIAQLTGYRYLDGYSSDEEQYTALMNAGVTFAQKYQLTPGVALTAEQMAQLTSDVVWLVEQTVTLPDGSTQKVLVPQVYVRVQPGDIDGSGALLSADRLTIKNKAGEGDFTNSGTVAGRSVVSITADNINELGGRILGGNVALDARADINIVGGTVDARDSLALVAGNDINVRTTTQSAQGSNGSSTNIDRIAGLYVTNPGGTLTASAGRDVNLVGAVVQNQGGGSTSIAAKRDINLGTVSESSSHNTVFNSSNFYADSSSRETGSTITTNGATVLSAGQDINLRQANVNAGDGLLVANAGRNLNIVDGQAEDSSVYNSQATKKGTFSKSTQTMSASQESATSVGSQLQGGLVSLHADNNVNIVGSQVSGTQGVSITAGNEVNVVEGRNASGSSASLDRSKKSTLIDPHLGYEKTHGDSLATSSNTASASTITSTQGGVYVEGGKSVYMQGAQVDAAKDLTIKGGSVTIAGAVNESTASVGERSQTKAGPMSLLYGAKAKSENIHNAEASSLTNSKLSGANVSITATADKGAVTIAGTTIDTPGKLKLEGDSVNLALQSTESSTSNTGGKRNLVWQSTKDAGTQDETLHYNQINAGSLEVNANRVTVGMNAQDSIEALSKQPGMEWVGQLTSDPKLAGKIDWQALEEAHKKWDNGTSGLTPEGAAVVTAVVTYLTWGVASTAGAGVASTVGGGAVTQGAVAAGISALASQASVALINNKGDLGKTLDDLGSSASVKSLATAIVTGGVLGGLNLNPTGLATTGGGASEFMDHLGKNLTAGAAKAVISTAINGGSLQDALRDGIVNAFLDTAAAQTANWIGDLTKDGTLNGVANKIAHAIAGCAVGAARTDGSCAAGALGAAIGELSAELYGRDIDTVQFANMMSSVAAAVAGLDANQITLAGQAGANAAANNYLKHDQWMTLADEFAACQQSPGGCSSEEQAALRAKYQKISVDQDNLLLAACQSGNAGQCTSFLAEALKGAVAQQGLVIAGKLPDSYWATGNDFSATAKLLASPDFKGATSEQAAAMVEKLASIVLDFTPVVGDIKGFVEAETPFDYTLAVVGVLGPVGDGIAKAVKEAKLAMAVGDSTKALHKLTDAESLIANNKNLAQLKKVDPGQLDRKFKHASDFGVITTKKNPETIGQFEQAIKLHLLSDGTKEMGIYGFVKDSKVFFNSTTNNVVVLDSAGEFVTGFKLSPGTPQYENFLNKGILR